MSDGARYTIAFIIYLTDYESLTPFHLLQFSVNYNFIITKNEYILLKDENVINKEISRIESY